MSTINASNYGDGTDSVPASAVIQGTAKAYLSLSDTTTIEESFNVSSVDDDGVGNYGVNFTSSLNASTYAVVVSVEVIVTVNGNAADLTDGTRATSSFDYQTYAWNAATNRTAQDLTSFCTVFGDLA